MAYSLKYIELGLKKCQSCDCSFTAEHRLEMHHIDRNRENNNPNNLVILCKVCHSRIHNPESEWRTSSVLHLRESGLTFEAIGKTLGISRQRVHQIYKKRSDILNVVK